MKKANKFYPFLGLIFILTSLNLCCSKLIAYKLAQGWYFSNPLFKIIYVENTGAAFSIMQNSTAILIGLSLFALCAMSYYIIKNIDKINRVEMLCWSFLIAGILGNLHERIFLGHVRDFFDLAFINFAIFNISDIFINLGVIGIILLILLTKKPAKKL